MNLAFRSAVEGGDEKPKLPGSLHVNRRLDRWLTLHAEGYASIHPGKVELGQGILTALAQIAAEELDVSLAQLRVVPASTSASPDEAVTSGSLSVQESGMALRHVCAEARAICLGVIAQRSGVAIEDIALRDGEFLSADGRLLGSYWSLAKADLLALEGTPGIAAKPATARRLAGSSTARLDLPDKVFGAPRYIQDLRLPGLLYARMVRPAARGAVLVALRDGLLPGDAAVFRDGSVLAAVASAEHHAEAAAACLAARAQWSDAATLPEEGALEAWLEAAAAEESVVIERAAEMPTPAPTPAHRVSRKFFRPLIAHASIGTCCAIARWQGDVLQGWTHSQGIYNLRADLAKALRIPVENILLQHVEGSGCYGHNGADDVMLDAALVARVHPGRPVRVLWSRAEELGWGPLSPAMQVRVEAEAAEDGALLRWTQRVVSNGHSGRPGRGALPTLLAASMLAEPFAVPSAINPPLAGGGGGQRNAVPQYRVPALRVELARVTDMPIRASALRGLGALVNVWAIESVMDDLAHAIGEDPLGYRLRHLDDARSRDVLAKVADMAGWATRVGREGVGHGLAVARYKGTGAWCAAVVEIEAAERIFCRRIWLAGDVGEVINPDGAVNQFEGGAIQATSMCLLEAARHDNRAITSDSWERYPILRFSEVPEVETHFIARPEAPPLGAGEASLAPVIAAIANAIHDALGARVTRWPFTPENIAGAKEED